MPERRVVPCDPLRVHTARFHQCGRE
jgi:hypothetical protein